MLCSDSSWHVLTSPAELEPLPHSVFPPSRNVGHMSLSLTGWVDFPHQECRSDLLIRLFLSVDRSRARFFILSFDSSHQKKLNSALRCRSDESRMSLILVSIFYRFIRLSIIGEADPMIDAGYKTSRLRMICFLTPKLFFFHVQAIHSYFIQR